MSNKLELKKMFTVFVTNNVLVNPFYIKMKIQILAVAFKIKTDKIDPNFQLIIYQLTGTKNQLQREPVQRKK